MIKHDIKIDFDENPRRILKQKQKSEKTVCFSSEKLSLMIKHDIKIDFDENPLWILKHKQESEKKPFVFPEKNFRWS